MKLICDQCGAKYSIADEKVRGKVFKIRCKKCQNVIVVRGTEQPSAQGAQAAYAPPKTADSASAEASAPQASAAEPAPEQARTWYVVIGREQTGPLSEDELRQRIANGEVHGESFVWQEGFSDWVQLATIPGFSESPAENAGQPAAVEPTPAPMAAEPQVVAAAVSPEPSASLGDDTAVVSSEAVAAAVEAAPEALAPQASPASAFSSFVGDDEGPDEATAFIPVASHAYDGSDEPEEDTDAEGAAPLDDGTQPSAPYPEQPASGPLEPAADSLFGDDGGPADMEDAPTDLSVSPAALAAAEAFSGESDPDIQAPTQPLEGLGAGQAEADASPFDAAAAADPYAAPTDALPATGGAALEGDVVEANLAATSRAGGSPFEAPPAASPGMRGARAENSVLFSLADLQDLAEGGEGASDEVAATMPPSSTTVSEASGLIDVRALALDTAGPDGLEELADEEDAADPVPVSIAPVMVPMVRKRSNTGLIVGVIVGVTAVVAVGVVAGVSLWKKGAQDKGASASAGAGTGEGSTAVAVATPSATAKPDGEGKDGDDAVSEGQEQGKASDQDESAAAPEDPSPAKAGKAKAKRAGRRAAKPKAAKPKAAKPKAAKPKAAVAPAKAAKPTPRPAPAARRPAKSPAKKRRRGDSDIDDLLGGLESSGSSRKRAPKKAKPAARPTNLPSSLNRSQIQGVVRKNAGKIRSCYKKQPEPKKKGTIMVSFQIQGSGRVGSPTVKTAAFKGTVVSRCVLSAVKSMRFPRFSGDPIKINYPFILR